MMVLEPEDSMTKRFGSLLLLSCLLVYLPADAVAQTNKSLPEASAADQISVDTDWRAAAVAWTGNDCVEFLKHAQVLVQRYPENALAHILLGQAYACLKFQTDAIAAFQQAVKLKPDNADAWSFLGDAYGEAGRTNDQIDAYHQAIKLKPDHATTWYMLGLSYAGMQKYTETANAWSQYVKLNPTNSAVWKLLGGAYNEIGDAASAKAAYRAAFKLNPKLGEEIWEEDATAEKDASLKLLKMTAADRGMKLEELILQGRLREQHDTAQRAAENLKEGDACAVRGDYQGAIVAYRKVITLLPTAFIGSTYTCLGSCYLQLGRYREAAEAYDLATKANPSNYVTWGLFGFSLAYDGQFPEAKKALDECASIAKASNDKQGAEVLQKFPMLLPALEAWHELQAEGAAQKSKTSP